MMNEHEHVPRALQEVWTWKDEIYRGVQHLGRREALHEIMNQAHEAAVKFGFASVASPVAPQCVAESHATYGETSTGAGDEQ